MKIGILTNYLALGMEGDSGIGQHYRILADSLADLGHTVHVVHPTLLGAEAIAALAILNPKWTCDVVTVRPSALIDSLIKESWVARVFYAQIWSAAMGNRALAKAVTARGLQVIETHATGTPALFYLRRRVRPPVATRVSTSQSQMYGASASRSRIIALQATVERQVVRASDALITHTIKHRDALCAIDGYDANAFTIIPHGLPEALPAAERERSDGSELEFLFVGRFESRKGIDVLLEAIPVIAAKYPQVRFTLAGSIGDGSYWNAFSARHPELVGRQVSSLGRVADEELAELYARCDVLVAPSRYESFGLIYVEAMRVGKPVIGCAAGGIPEVITDGVTGLLAQPGDVASLEHCIERMISEPELRSRMGEAGRCDFELRFSARRMAMQSVQFYEKLAADFASEGV